MDRLREMEKWERTSVPRTGTPLVTIQKDGLFSLNEAAFKAMGEPKRVEIFYDSNESTIAFAPTVESNLSGYPPRRQATGATWLISGLKFTRHYSLDTSVARRYVVDVDDKILFVNLKGPSTVATKGPTRTRPTDGTAQEG